MFFSFEHMAKLQEKYEYGASAILGSFPTYFITANHIISEVEKEKVAPMIRKLLNMVAGSERFCGEKALSSFNFHFVETNSQILKDHSTWPGRMFIGSDVQSLFAVDEVGLATIIGHSLAHAFLNHKGEETSVELFENAAWSLVPVLVVLAIASKQMRIPAATYCLCVGAFRKYYQQTHTKMLEKEADMWGLEVMKLAGYDVTKATEYWERKTNYVLRMIDDLKIQRRSDSIDARSQKEIDQYMDFYRQILKINKRHIATIQEYIQDNGILPLAVEEPKGTENPPKSTNPKDEPGPDVPESKQ
ncbi:hypothetical protein SBOR_5734 [Sclerotinia borealis F-4128]|uniref:Peptidase M48 domain-containing protein n=1 Tax=Sclerotinia borealis (strain F-4128) TaxID=1432307 RepID=W9CDE5_SCLBF|nr:hypothetical protein SBOR_5734 [Sclerotinia borealis F-4128]